MTPTFYVYEHWRPDTGTCFYVGKGRGRRAYVFGKRNIHHGRIRAKPERSGLAVDVRVVATGLTETEAFEEERARITFWRSQGTALANQTDGGEGRYGLRLTEEAKEHLRALATGRRPSEATRAKMSASRLPRRRARRSDRRARDR